MIRGLASLYSWRYPTVLIYMLQSTEYQVGPYLDWYWHTTNFAEVMQRRTLKRTKAVRLLLLALRAGMALEVVAGLVLLALWRWHGMVGGWEFGAALLIAYPVVWAHAVVVPLIIGRIFVVKPRQRKAIRHAEQIFSKTDVPKIAIAGSYGKTSMKELLLTVLGEGKTVAATPANRNVSISHANFARTLQGDEEILIIEYGEGAPGDVERFTAQTHPTHAIITGVAPAHLDHYKTVHAAGQDIFSVAKVIKGDQVYVNGESPYTENFMKERYQTYDQSGALGWKVSDVRVNLDGTRFTLKKGRRTLRLHSGLLGRHQVGPLSLAAALAAEFGFSDEQIEAGVAKTKPFEHRMQPYQLGDAWIIDDTYNGNIEGIRVGTELLKELPGKRKMYITPGLVDQGAETEAVHEEMGRLIAEAQPDTVVLMRHSVTPFIQKGLEAAGFAGELRIEKDPLSFYNNLSLVVAAGDLVLMQNDWTDNYH
ncbi:MAG TPA: Mur ligase family protein [Candidatus Saccharimonadales bacterium]|nr:Mur ligase family protein [Candidatus Saccharimonadales bacterium]